jgi:hypothetical protein
MGAGFTSLNDEDLAKALKLVECRGENWDPSGRLWFGPQSVLEALLLTRGIFSSVTNMGMLRK